MLLGMFLSNAYFLFDCRIRTACRSTSDSIVLAVTSYSFVYEIHFSIRNPPLRHQKVEKDFSHHRIDSNQLADSSCSDIYCLGLKILSLWLSSCPVCTKCYLDFLCSGVTDYPHVVFGNLYYSSDVLETPNGKLINIYIYIYRSYYVCINY